MTFPPFSIRSFSSFSEGITSDCPKEQPTSICMIEAPNNYYIKGYGDNRKSAKLDACRKGLKCMETFV